MFKNIQKRFETTESYVSLILGIAVVLVMGVLIYNFVAFRNQKTTTSPSSSTNEEALEASVPGGEHMVAAGETLWSISEKYYKTGYNWKDIANANHIENADKVEAGQIVAIPTVTPIFPEGQIASGETVKKPEANTYTVLIADTLWGVAVAQYGDGYKWVEIAKANALVNPDLIHPGNVLALP